MVDSRNDFGNVRYARRIKTSESRFAVYTFPLYRDVWFNKSNSKFKSPENHKLWIIVGDSSNNFNCNILLTWKITTSQILHRKRIYHGHIGNQVENQTNHGTCKQTLSTATKHCEFKYEQCQEMFSITCWIDFVGFYFNWNVARTKHHNTWIFSLVKCDLFTFSTW